MALMQERAISFQALQTGIMDFLKVKLLHNSFSHFIAFSGLQKHIKCFLKINQTIQLRIYKKNVVNMATA
jgi:hypothetical protein